MSTPLQIFGKRSCQTLKVAAVSGSPHVSRILFVTDHKNRLRFLIDNGAEISLIPPKRSERLRPNPDLVLQAVNSSNIKTYDQRFLELDLGLRSRCAQPYRGS